MSRSRENQSRIFGIRRTVEPWCSCGLAGRWGEARCAGRTVSSSDRCARERAETLRPGDFDPGPGSGLGIHEQETDTKQAARAGCGKGCQGEVVVVGVRVCAILDGNLASTQALHGCQGLDDEQDQQPGWLAGLLACSNKYKLAGAALPPSPPLPSCESSNE
jgi:hypothetical protein